MVHANTHEKSKKIAKNTACSEKIITEKDRSPRGGSDERHGIRDFSDPDLASQ
jgi:hypothetical protein